MSKGFCSFLAAFCFLYSVPSMSIDSGAQGNLIILDPVYFPSSTTFDQPIHVTGCCDAEGDGAYCTDGTLPSNTFGIRIAEISGFPGCPTAGVKLTPGYYPTNCQYRYGSDWCHFPLPEILGRIARRIRVYAGIVARIGYYGGYEFAEYAPQAGATGWPGTTIVSTWGFDGAGLNFNNPQNFVTSQAVLVQPEDACSAITNAADLVGKTAVIMRGTCQFGTKILKAQNAGAVSTVIINNVDTDITLMDPGTDGAAVTIPAVFVPNVFVQRLKLLIEGGDWVEFTMGNIS
jgi:hypothetical protein